MGAPIEVPADATIAPQLQSAYRDARSVTITLATGERFYVVPDRDIEDLFVLLNSPDFVPSLERSLKEFREGDFEIIERAG